MVLLMIASFGMLGVTLFMRFRSEWAGSLPVLNFPGPKLWASALLQRSIGSAPGEWGVAGTRFGLLGLGAVWLLTAPRAVDRLGESALSIRRLTRWGSLLSFGALLGVLLGEDGVGYWEVPERDVYLMLLVALVELPATTLLYVHLRNVALSLREPSLRQPMNILAFAVPLCIGAAVLAFILGDYWRGTKEQIPQQTLIAGYGAACVAVGVLASATLARLGLLLLPATLGGASALGIRQFVLDTYRRAKLAAVTRSGKLHRYAMAGGLLAWLGISGMLLKSVLMLDFRTGVGANLPMINVVGPKVWAVPLAARFDGWHDSASNAMLGVLLGIVCIWLITVRPESLRETAFSPRRLGRWGPTVLVGLGFGFLVGFGGGNPALPLAYSPVSAMTLPLTMFVEGPATLLLFLHLACLARDHGDGRLSRHLGWAGILSVTLILGGNGFFLLSRLGVEDGTGATLLVGIYGTSAVAVGLWSTFSVLRLTKLLLTWDAQTERQMSLFPA